jgi:hypothetical protein
VVFAIRYLFPEIRDEVPENFQDNRIFETRITRMVTNLVALKSIDESQFVRVPHRQPILDALKR